MLVCDAEALTWEGGELWVFHDVMLVPDEVGCQPRPNIPCNFWLDSGYAVTMVLERSTKLEPHTGSLCLWKEGLLL